MADDPQTEAVKTVEELLAMGGKFYVLGQVSWCDTATESWKLVPGKGYVRFEEPESYT